MNILVKNVLIFLKMPHHDLFYVDSNKEIVSLNYCDYPDAQGSNPVFVGLNFDQDNVKYHISGNIVIILLTNLNDIGERKYYNLTIDASYDEQYKIDFRKTEVVSIMEITQLAFENNPFDKYNNSPGSMTKSVK